MRCVTTERWLTRGRLSRTVWFPFLNCACAGAPASTAQTESIAAARSVRMPPFSRLRRDNATTSSRNAVPPVRDERYAFLPSAFCLLPSAFCLLPFAFCLLPFAFCLPSFVFCLCLLSLSSVFCLLS